MDRKTAHAPSDEESAKRAVAPFREMTPAERWTALSFCWRRSRRSLGAAKRHDLDYMAGTLDSILPADDPRHTELRDLVKRA